LGDAYVGKHCAAHLKSTEFRERDTRRSRVSWMYTNSPIILGSGPKFFAISRAWRVSCSTRACHLTRSLRNPSMLIQH